MKKFLLIMAASILTAFSAQARIISPTEGQVWWGYFNESDFNTAEYTVGTGQAMTLMAGIYIPPKHAQLGQSTIQAVRVYVDSNVTSSLSNMKIWISKQLPNSVSDADVVQTTLGTLTAGANDFKLRAGYEVNDEGFYIGYCVKSTTGYFIKCGGTDAPNSFWIGNPESGMGWSDLNGNGLGKLAFQILVEGGNFPSDCAVAEDFGQQVVVQGDDVSVPITITNKGLNPIDAISYIVTTDGESTEEKNVSLGSLPLNASKTVNIPFASDKEPRKYQKTFTITQVDGKPNTASNPSATGFLITLNDKKPATPVIEEFTGTWCGWCPRGTVGMQKVHETYGDQVVQIAVHSGDPMEISAYSAILNAYAEGYPSSITDRQILADPSFSSLKSVLGEAFKRVPVGAITLAANWENSEQKKVVFKTATQFSYNEDNGKYGIAYVLVEDGLKGTGSNWAQANYYSGMSTQQAGTDMQWWCKQGSSVSGVEYNHVAVAGWSVQNGVTGSVSSAFKAGDVQEYTFTGSIATNSLIQDKTKLKAVALLIDRTDGSIVNAAQAIIEDNATGIQAVENGEWSMPDNQWFDLSGRKIQTSQKGVNIIRMGDGTVKKVLVK